MADFDKIGINGTYYDVKDTTARQKIIAETAAREQAVNELVEELSQTNTTVENVEQQIADLPVPYRQYRNVLEYGADPTGSKSSTAAFNAAISAGGVVFVPTGSYSIPGMSLPDNVNIIIDKNATFAPDILPSTTEDQMFYSVGAPGELVTPWSFVRDNNNYTSGTPRGFVKYGVLFKENNNNQNDPFFHWNVLVQTNNSTSNDAENVGLYSLMVDKNDGRVWAICTDTQDPTDGNPTQQKYGIEIGFNCGGQDVNGLRIPLHISLSRKQGATGGVATRAIYVTSDGTQEMSFTYVIDVRDVNISSLTHFQNVTCSGSILDLSGIASSQHGLNLGNNDIQMGRFTISKGNSDTQLAFKIDGATVGYIDSSGWHNGAPA